MSSAAAVALECYMVVDVVLRSRWSSIWSSPDDASESDAEKRMSVALRSAAATVGSAAFSTRDQSWFRCW